MEDIWLKVLYENEFVEDEELKCLIKNLNLSFLI